MKIFISETLKREFDKWEFAVHPPDSDFDFNHTHILLECKTKVDFHKDNRLGKDLVEVNSVKTKEEYKLLSMHMKSISLNTKSESILKLKNKIAIRLNDVISLKYDISEMLDRMWNYEDHINKVPRIVWIHGFSENTRYMAVSRFLFKLNADRDFIISNTFITRKIDDNVTTYNPIILILELSKETDYYKFNKLCEDDDKFIFITSEECPLNYFDKHTENFSKFLMKKNTLTIKNITDLKKFNSDPLRFRN